MPRKYCVLKCKTGYDSQNDEIKIPTFRLPSVKTDAEERLKWIEVLDAVNGSWKVSDDTVVCEKHWPEGYSVCRRKGHERPSEPPSVFASGIFIHSPSQPLKEKEAI